MDFITKNMSLTKEDLAQIQALLSSELNGKLDKKFQPLYERFDHIDNELTMINDRLDRIEKNVEANASSIRSLSGDI